MKNRHKTKYCKNCHEKPAGFRQNRKWKSDKDHDLCQRCYNSAMDAMKHLAGVCNKGAGHKSAQD